MSSPQQIAADTVVGIHYTLTLDSGAQVDSSVGGEPLLYLHGHGNIVPGLEAELTSHKVGDRVMVTVPPAKGYGERQPNATQAVPRHAFPPGETPRPGMQFGIRDEDGDVVPVWVAKVTKDEIVLDFNHPLAGENLHFEVEVVSIRGATQEELRHGHPHGPHGHD
ncbi:MAG TPA: peptidylprolyl isomerase, partial [Planctomycetota bacterium]|nr:peptidylprolyl isomerase [Planctomycetota bacterium]